MDGGTGACKVRYTFSVSQMVPNVQALVSKASQVTCYFLSEEHLLLDFDSMKNKGLVTLRAHCHGFVLVVARERWHFVFPFLFYFGPLHFLTKPLGI